MHFNQLTLMNMDCYKYISLSSFLPNDPVRKFRALEDLVQHGLPFPCVTLTYSSGNNIGNLHFLWKVPSHVDPILSLQASQNRLKPPMHVHVYIVRTCSFISETHTVCNSPF